MSRFEFGVPASGGPLRQAAVTLALVVPLAACSTFGGEEEAPMEFAEAPYYAVRFPMPAETSIDRNATIVVGNATEWFGTLVLKSDQEIDEVQRFYTDSLAASGWSPLSTLISRRVVLQYVDRARGRSCVISLDPGNGFWGGGTEIEIVLAPLTGTTMQSSFSQVY
jgi:hypothetical protein